MLRNSYKRVAMSGFGTISDSISATRHPSHRRRG